MRIKGRNWPAVLSSLSIAIFFLTLAGLPSDTGNRLRVRSNGKASLQLNLKQITDPDCIVVIDFSTNNNFSLPVEYLTVGPANFRSGIVNFRLSSKPADSDGQPVPYLYSRIRAECPGRAEPVYLETQKTSLSALSDLSTVSEHLFLSELTGKTLGSSLIRSRAGFKELRTAVSAIKQAPVITRDLEDEIISSSQDLVLRLGIEASKPLKFQWLFSAQGEDEFSILKNKGPALEIINDSRSSTLIIRSKLTDLSSYSNGKIKVVAKNKYGQATSTQATITVNDLPPGSGNLTPTVVPTVFNTAVPTKTPQIQCTPLACRSGLLRCLLPEGCPGGCGTVCVANTVPPTKTATASRTSLPPTITPSRTPTPIITPVPPTVTPGRTASATATRTATSSPTRSATSTPVILATATRTPVPPTIVPTLAATAPSSNNKCSSISQFGITWTFNTSYSCGQFANGDWWVVGPVRINAISPESDADNNGTMVGPDEPSSWPSHGFDVRIDKEFDSYSSDLNISKQLPYTVPVNKSVISSVSNSLNKPRNQINEHAVLTVLSSAPPQGSFRPTYFGSDKTIKWNKNQINYSRLKSVVNSGYFSLTELEEKFSRPLVMLGLKDQYKGMLLVSNNYGTYGREVAIQMAKAGLAINSNLSNSQKEKLLIGFIQVGLDIYEGVKRGNYVYPNGGWVHGFKLPTIVAGYLLNDDDILRHTNANTLASDGRAGIFAEDRSHAYVDQNDVNTARLNADSDGTGCVLYSGGVCTRPIEPYASSMIGMPEWLIEGQKNNTGSQWGTIYRDVVGPGLIGHALVAHIMGLENLWNDPAFFDYVNQRSWPFYSSYYLGTEAQNWAAQPATTDANGNVRNSVDSLINRAWISLRSPIGKIPASYAAANSAQSNWPRAAYPVIYPSYGNP